MRSRIVTRPRLLFASALLAAPPLFAQTVTSSADSGPGTLREALDNAVPDAQIGFQLGGGASPTILLPDGADPLEVGVDGVRIDGSGAAGLTLSGTQLMPSDPLPVILRLDAGGAEDELEIVDVNQRVGMVELGGVLTYRTNNDTTLDVDIVDLAGGTGELIKTGPATLFLLGDNAFSGGLSVVQGTVRGPGAGFPGDVANGGSVVFDEPIDDPMSPTPGLYTGLISDYQPDMGDPVPGQVTKTGEGELRWSGGTHDYSGGTQIEQGRLVLSTGTTLPVAGAVTVLGPATLELELDALSTATLDGALDGAGRFELEGTDATSVLALGAGSFSGDFVFTSGPARVLDAANVLRGDIDFASSSGTLELRSDATLAGALSGTGTLRVDPAAGSGSTVTLSGTNSHTSTEVVSGTLIGTPRSLVGAIDNGAALSVSPAGATLFEAVVSGAGSFTKTSGGSLVIAVDQPFTGATAVDAGTLDLQADLSGTASLAVAASATLTGFGDAPAAVLDVSGRLDPSDPGDPIRVASASFAPGSTLRMDVRDDGSADLLESSGDIDAAGAELELVIAEGDYSGPGVTATLLESTGGSVSAPTLGSGFPFLTVTPVSAIDRFEVTISGDLSDVSALARTPNQRAVAAYLQPQLDAVAGPPDDEPFDAVAERFFALPSEAAVRRAFDSMGGEAHSALIGANLTATQRLDRTLHRRARGASVASGRALWGGGGDAFELGAAKLPRAARGFHRNLDEAWRPVPTPNLWLDLWGGFGHLDGGSDSDLDQSLAGVFLGADAPAGPLQIGAALGYSFADVELDAARTDTRAHGLHAALYVSTSSPLGSLSVAGRYVFAWNSSERRIALPGGSEEADADFDTDGGGVGVEGGLNLLRCGPALLQGVASFDWTRLNQESFDESGAGPLDLEVASERIDSLRTGLGMRLNGRVELGGGVDLLPELRLRWLHEFGDTRRQVSARFADAPVAGGFSLSGAEAPRDALLAGLGWTGEVSEALRIHADYDALVDADRVDHRLSIGAQVSF